MERLKKRNVKINVVYAKEVNYGGYFSIETIVERHGKKEGF